MVKSEFFEVRIRLQSFNILSLELIKKELSFFARCYGLKCSSINLPVKKMKYNVLKSPHVNKKARDQLEIVFFNRLVVLRGGNFFDFSLLRSLEKIFLNDVSTKLVILKKKEFSLENV